MKRNDVAIGSPNIQVRNLTYARSSKEWLPRVNPLVALKSPMLKGSRASCSLRAASLSANVDLSVG